MKNLFLIFLTIFFNVMFLVADHAIDLDYANTNADLLMKSDFGMSVNYRISEIKSFDVNTERGNFSQIRIEGYSYSTEIGLPKLPVLRKIIAVPLNAEVSIKMLNSEISEFSLSDFGIDDQIIPAQASVSKSAKPEDIEFILNEDVYSVNRFDEKEIVSAEELGIMRGLRLFTLTLAPVKYNPATNTIKVYNNIDVQVDFVGGDIFSTNELREKTFSPYFEKVYSSSVFNYSEPNLRDDLTNYPIKYLIVSDRMFEAQLQPFIEWKTEKGFEVVIGYTDDIGTSTNAIKSYLQDIYNTSDPAPSFVLFVGDVSEIPAWSGNTGSHVTDLDHCEYTGDYMPEIYYGRFSARNTSELQPQIDKTLEYEKYEMPDPSFLGEVVMIAGMDTYHGSTWGNGQINYGTTYYFNEAHGIYSHTYLYPESGSNSQNIINNVSDGVAYINYTAHGGATEWCDPQFTLNDLYGLQNESKYPLAVGNCCLTNKFEVGECFGEAWLRAENKGAIGYIGGTNSTYWDEDYWWGVGAGSVVAHPTYETTGPGAYDGMFHDHGEAFSQWYTTSYSTIMAGNLAVVEGGGNQNLYWEIYALMGDPSLSAYFGVPEVNTASYPETIFLGFDEIQITAEPYSYVGLSMNGELYGNGLIDDTGSMTLEFEPFIEPGMAKLVITRQNRQPIIADVEVIPNEGAYVVINDYTIDADGDEIIEYGEYVSLSVDLENVGIDDAIDLTMTISCDDEYITIDDDIQNIGDLIAGTIESFPNSFSFSVANDIPDNHQFTLNYTISEGDRDLWEGTIILTAFAPVINFGSFTVIDGENGRLDPGETADLVVTLNNIGGASATGITAALSTAGVYITVNSGTDELDELEAYSDGNVTFNVTATGDTPVGQVINFNLNITADLEYSNSEFFFVTVGLCLEDFESGDFLSYPWEFDGQQDWQIVGNAYEGNFCAQSGDIGDSQFTSLIVELEVVAAGEISFWKKVSCENHASHIWDYLAFIIDGNEQERWSGEVSWSEESYPVSAGTHTFEWQYAKDGSVSEGEDCAWLDFIVFPSAGAGDPVLHINVDSIEMELDPDDSDTFPLELTNIGGGVINYTIDIDSNNSWLSLPVEVGDLLGGETDDIDVTFDSSNLNAGEYTCNIVIIDDIRNETFILVTLTVNPTSAEDELLPAITQLNGNFPNPFNPITNIKYSLNKREKVSLEIYNLKGQKVRSLVNEEQDAGFYNPTWNGKDDNGKPVSSGIFFYKFKAGSKFTSTKKMILMK